MTREMQAMRRAIERDRYGLVAQVLLARDRCTPTQCAAYRSLTDNHQIITNMDEHAFDNLVARYCAVLERAAGPTAATGPLAMLPPSLPTGRPTNAEFPSAANTPPVSIMTPEPGTGAKPPGAARCRIAHATAAAPRRPGGGCRVPAAAAAKKAAGRRNRTRRPRRPRFPQPRKRRRHRND